jgi:hypothetical protein
VGQVAIQRLPADAELNTQLAYLGQLGGMTARLSRIESRPVELSIERGPLKLPGEPGTPEAAMHAMRRRRCEDAQARCEKRSGRLSLGRRSPDG